jgi:eukaryotic-like serine/threonine-protein kinase
MHDDIDTRLDTIAAEIVADFRAGRTPNVAELCVRHADLAEEIRELFPTLIQLEIARPSEQSPRLGTESSHATVEWATLGDYQLIHEIGRGGMGIVYEAVQTSLNRRVALKVLSPYSMRAARNVRRFQREALAAAQLHHTNIVPVLGVGHDQGVHYLVMQLINGSALDEVISAIRAEKGIASSIPPTEMARAVALRLRREAKDSLSAYWRNVATIGKQVAEALHYAHGQGVVHRDVKPSNLIVNQDGSLSVVDFGLAKTAESVDLTVSGELLGTLRYLAPERLQGESDARADVYGLGATLYELATLHPPFEARDNSILLKQIVDIEPPRASALDRRIPADLETIIAKAMAKRPADRYTSPAELADDLRRFLGDLPIRARRTSMIERAWRWCRRRPTVAVPTLLAAALLIVVAVGSTIVSARLRQETQTARAAEHARRLELFRAHLTSAHSASATERIGQRLTGLRSIRDALDVLKPESPNQAQTFALVDAAIPCLARSDLRVLHRAAVIGRHDNIDVDPTFSALLEPSPTGAGVVVRSLHDPSEQQEFPSEGGEASTFNSWRSFSRGGRWIIEIAFRSNRDDSKRGRVWERATGRVAADIPHHAIGHVFDFHPDERHLLVAGHDGILRWFDLESGAIVRESSRLSRTQGVRFSPQGRWLAVLGPTGAAEIVDPQTWTTKEVVREAPQATGIEFENEDALLVGSHDGGIYRWQISARTGHSLKGAHQGVIHRLRLSPDGKQLASADESTVQLRDVEQDEIVLTIPGNLLRYSTDSTRIAVNVRDQLTVYEYVPSRVVRARPFPAIESARWSPDGRLLGITGRLGVEIVEARQLESRADLGLDHCGNVAFAPDSSLVTMGTFSHACYWPMRGAESVTLGPPLPLFHARIPDFAVDRLSPQHQGRAADIGPQGRLAVADYRRGVVLTADAPNEPLREFASLLNVARVAVSPDDRWIAGAAVLSTMVCVWSAEDARAVLHLPGFSSIAFSPDGAWFATRSADELRLYKTADWRLAHRVDSEPTRNEFFRPLAFQPHGQLLAVTGSGQRIHLYDRQTAELIARLPPLEEAEFSHLSFSPDGSRLIVVRKERGITEWNLADLERELVELGISVPSHALGGTGRQAPTIGPPERIHVVRGAFTGVTWHDCWRRLAEREADKRNFSDAVHDMQLALVAAHRASAEQRAELLTIQGDYQLQNDEFLAACTSFKSAVAENSRSEAAFGALMRLLVLGPTEVRNASQAIQLLGARCAIDSADRDAIALLGIAQFRAGQVQRAEQTLVAVSATDELKPAVAYVLALAYQSQGDTTSARSAFERGEVAHSAVLSELAAPLCAMLDHLRAEAADALKVDLSIGDG